jgi:hypothetical protein
VSIRIARARESWLNDGNDEHFGDAALLCGLGDLGRCGDGKCRLDGFCFRGLGSAEVRHNIERRLDQIEEDIRELMLLAFDQRRQLAIAKMRGEVLEIRSNVLPFVARRSEGGRNSTPTTTETTTSPSPEVPPACSV